MTEIDDKIQLYFDRVNKLFDEFNDNDISLTQLVELEKLAEYPIVELLYQRYFNKIDADTDESRLQKQAFFENFLDSKNVNRKAPYIPIELVNDGPCAYFGDYDLPYIPNNLVIFKPICSEKKFVFTDGKTNYDLLSFSDLNLLAAEYKNIILADSSFYNYYDSECYKRISSLKSGIENYKFYYKQNKLTSAANSVKKIFWQFVKGKTNEQFLCNEINKQMRTLYEASKINIYQIDYLNYFDNSNLPFIHNIIPIEKSDFSAGSKPSIIFYVTDKDYEEILKKQNDSIYISVSNLKNIQGEDFKNNGYVKVSRTIPLEITPINVSEEDFNWLQEYFKKYNVSYYAVKNFEQALISSCQSIEDMLFVIICIDQKLNLNKSINEVILKEPIVDLDLSNLKWNKQIFNMQSLIYSFSHYFSETTNTGIFYKRISDSYFFRVPFCTDSLKPKSRKLFIDICQRIFNEIQNLPNDYQKDLVTTNFQKISDILLESENLEYVNSKTINKIKKLQK